MKSSPTCKEITVDENCHVEPIIKNVPEIEPENVKVTQLVVWGMGCHNCANRVHNSLISLNGVLQVQVDHAMGMAFVEHDPDKTSTDELISAVTNAGGDGRHEYSALLM
jgi:copper chaperone CopZ